MKRNTLILLALAAAQNISAAQPLPKDVQAFVANANACEHLAGEWDGELPKDRRTEIARAIKKFCAPAQRQLPILIEKYKRDPKLCRTLLKYAYDSVRSYTEVPL